MSLEKQSLKEIINFRLQKLKKLRDSGIDPYPHNFKPTNYSNQLKTEFKSYENKDVFRKKKSKCSTQVCHFEAMSQYSSAS